jgi:hypothetical protein
MGCSPSSSEITINASVKDRERGSDFTFGLITCKIKVYEMSRPKWLKPKPNANILS